MEDNKNLNPITDPELGMGAHDPKVDMARNKNLFKKSLYFAGGFVVILIAVCVFQLYAHHSTQQEMNQVDYKAVSGNATDSLVRQKVIAGYRKVAEDGSGNAHERALILAAGSYYEQGDYKKALENIEQVRTKSILFQTLKYILEGDCYVNLDKFDDALNAYNEAIEEAKGNTETTPYIMHKIANVYRYQGKFKEEADMLKRLQASYPDFYTNLDAEIARAEQKSKSK